MKKITKLLSILLIISFLIPNIVSAEWEPDNATQMAGSSETIESDPLALQPPPEPPTVPSAPTMEKLKTVTESVYDQNWTDQFKDINEKALEDLKGRLNKQVHFAYSKKDIEALLLAGATKEDIYFSDELGNTWLVNPHELFERKQKNDQTWEAIEADLITEKQQKRNELLSMFPVAEEITDFNKMNLAEQVEVLSDNEQNDGISIEHAITRFLDKGIFSDTTDSFSISKETQVDNPAVDSSENLTDGIILPANDFNGCEAAESNLTVGQSVYQDLTYSECDSNSQLNSLIVTNYEAAINSVFDGLIVQMQINQTQKPQFSDFNGNSESIDPASGKLTYKRNDLSLPGRDGLDLNIGVMYDSNYSFGYMKNESYTPKKYNYLISRYDLGLGWSFTFPSIQKENGYLYYHKGDGAIYTIDFSAYNVPDNYTHLIGYQGKDLQLVRDTQASYSNGQDSSAYYLEYADKRREYFSEDGRLLGIVDRYGNAIKFQYAERKVYDGKTYKVINTITDTIGRVVSFSYESHLQDSEDTFKGENVVLTVKDSLGNEKQKITYQKWRGPMTFSGAPDGYYPYLYYIQDQNSEYTTFSYQNEQSYYHPDRSSKDSYSGYTSYNTLTMVNEPRAVSQYTYGKVTRSFNGSGFSEEFRVKSRFDQIKRNNTAEGDYNHVDITYTGDYTGYNPGSPGYIPSSFTYSSTRTVKSTTPTNNLVSTTNFNQYGQITSTTNKASNGEWTEIKNTTYDSTYRSMPTATEKRIYGSSSDTAPDVLYSGMQYTDWGGLKSETVPLTYAQYSNSSIKSKYTTTYTYDPTYYFLKTKSWYQKESDTTAVTEQYDYYANGRIKSYTDPANIVTTYCYETVTNTSNCSNPSAAITGNVSKIRKSTAINTNQTSIQDTYFGSETQYAYPSEVDSYFTDISDRKSQQPITQIVKKTMTYYLESGLLQSEKDGNGQTTSYEYDPLGRPTKVTYPSFTNTNGTVYDVTDEYTYRHVILTIGADNENSGVNGTEVHSYRKYVQQSNGATNYLSNEYSVFDGLGFLRITRLDGNQNTQYHTDDQTRPIYAIDPMGNTINVAYNAWGDQNEAMDTYGNLYVTERNLKARQKSNYFVESANVSSYRANSSQNALKASYVEQTYDQWGNLLSNQVYKDWPTKSSPLSEQYSYDMIGNVLTYIDPKKNLNSDGVTSKYTYDADNRLTQVKNALNQITKYQYDGNGQIVQTTVQSGETGTPSNLFTKSFNEIGQKTKKTDNASKQETNSYNNLGLLRKTELRDGTTNEYQYDEQYRPVVQTITKPSYSQVIRKIIGSNGILSDTTEVSENGRITSTLTTQMDLLKRMKGYQVKGDGSSLYSSNVGFQYDNNNRLTRLDVGGNTGSTFVTQYKYVQQRLDKVQTNGLSTINSSDAVNVKYTYNPNGQVKSITYPPLKDGSILKIDYLYDTFNRISTVTNTIGTKVLSSYAYTYDDNGNVLSEKIVNSYTYSQSQFTYDKLNRIASASNSVGTTNYDYDLKGNRTIKNFISGTIPIGLDDFSYSYDALNRLASFTHGTVTTVNSYSADGMRYRKQTGTNVKQYRYNANQEVVAEVDGNDQVTANYVRGDRLLVKKDIATNQDYYYLYNGHGDVVQIVNTSGTVVDSYLYDEWGSILKQTEQVPNSFKYAGEVYDDESGLYYLRARFYDPSVGRFINEDTVEGQVDNPLSQNQYTYVHNNPLIYSDPTGHWCTSADGKYSHPGGCDGGNGNTNVKHDVNGSKYTPDYEHNGSPIKYNNIVKGKATWDDLDLSDLKTKNQIFQTSSNSSSRIKIVHSAAEFNSISGPKAEFKTDFYGGKLLEVKSYSEGLSFELSNGIILKVEVSAGNGDVGVFYEDGQLFIGAETSLYKTEFTAYYPVTIFGNKTGYYAVGNVSFSGGSMGGRITYKDGVLKGHVAYEGGFGVGFGLTNKP